METPPESEIADLRVQGIVLTNGSGKAAMANVPIGDGIAPVILIRFGADDDGVTVADVTAGGFESRGSIEEDLKSTGEVMAMVAHVLTTTDPIETGTKTQ